MNKEEILKIESRARQLALQFLDATQGKKWFKVLHVKRVVNESEDSIKMKLLTLVNIGLAVVKNFNGEDKYMITVTNDQKMKYLTEYKDWILSELKKTELKIEKYNA